ncbi:unnamed protein product [Symbiodinium necroappetens]|uniref:Uncharacterized protein n=1 Tax=Symbiodinium necroappetens TaxID=1628268 RepID=A0A813C2H6_9DINO|nr:unnamed protein product [Symbiodinium necroappetens]
MGSQEFLASFDTECEQCDMQLVLSAIFQETFELLLSNIEETISSVTCFRTGRAWPEAGSVGGATKRLVRPSSGFEYFTPRVQGDRCEVGMMPIWSRVSIGGIAHLAGLGHFFVEECGNS